MSFDNAPVLSDNVVNLHPLRADDRAALASAASDPHIWAGHPQKDRHLPAIFDPYFNFLLEKGGTLVIEEADTGKVIGCSRYYVGPDAPDDIGIGFTFLIRTHWGGASNWRIKTLMLNHAFNSFGRVWFHIGVDNIRSQKATAKLGGQRHPNRRLDLAGLEAEWVIYCLSRADWQASNARR